MCSHRKGGYLQSTSIVVARKAGRQQDHRLVAQDTRMNGISSKNCKLTGSWLLDDQS